MTGKSSSIRSGALTVFKNQGAFAYSYPTERYRYTEWINQRSKIVARDLFDYQTDPGETRNLIDVASYTHIRSKLAKELRKVADGCDRLIKSSAPD